MILITDSQYFPPVIFYKNSINFLHVKIDVYDTYQKMSFRNRCVVAGSNGAIILSIPLQEGRNQRRPVKEVRIANSYKWQLQHWRTISSCYNRSPWFDYYREELERLYEKPFDWLVDWNQACAGWMNRQLGLPVNMGTTDCWQPVYAEPEYADWRNRFTPKNLATDYSGAPVYRQVFEEKLGFIPHLSILDLLFCEGRRAASILQTG